MVRTYFVASLLVACAAGCGWSAPSKPNIKVSKATTYITQPLDSEGFVDYVEAVNQKQSQGVTTDNNFEVVLRQILGTAVINTEFHTEYFKRLGIPIPDPAGKYFRTFPEYHNTTNSDETSEILKEYALLSAQPWSAIEHPRGKQWLAAEGPLLDRFVEATKRLRNHTPYLTDEDGTHPRMLSVRMPSLHMMRELSQSLRMRVYMRVQQGELVQPRNDLQALHRLARLMGQGAFLIELMAAKAIEAETLKVYAAILRSGELTSAACKLFLNDLDALTPLPSCVKTINQGERLMALDAVQSLARSNGTSLNEYLERDSAKLSQAFGGTLDWNMLLATLNREYDRLEAAFRATDRTFDESRFTAYEQSFEELRIRVRNTAARSSMRFPSSSQERGKQAGEALFCFMGPAFYQMYATDKQAQAMLSVTRAGYAAELFRLEHGHNPKSLAELVPNTLEQIPLDPLTGKPLLYRLKPNSGSIVYSVGLNLMDDRGEPPTDDFPYGDDIVILGPVIKVETK